MERTIYEQSRDLTETCQVVHASSGSVRSWQMCFTSDAFESASADQKRGGNRWQPVATCTAWPICIEVQARSRSASRPCTPCPESNTLQSPFDPFCFGSTCKITVNYISLLFKLLVNSLDPCWSSECARMLKLLGCWTAKISNMPCLHQQRQRSNYHKACRETGQAQFPHAAPRSSWSSWSSWSSSQHTNWGLL